jgi:7,8-dihydropterin-6-yl-methyl-4-(beta-D-ribofuranosyl)aminobenzene 5'-phosphate synthase
MEFRVTTLVENSVPMGRGLVGEHGLSFLIEAGDKKVLFDTGQGLALARNAGAMGIDLGNVDAVVLSHGHYDHTGGLDALISVNRRFTLFAHPDAFSEKYSKRNDEIRPVGISMTQNALEEKGIRVVLGDAPLEIVPGITTTGEVPMKTAYERIDPALFARRGDTLIPDPMKDDLSLVLNTGTGTVVLLGCAHRGVINILNHVQGIAAKKRRWTVAGGLHLAGTSEMELKPIIAALESFSPELLAPGHCTGFPALWMLRAAFTGRLRLNQVGSVIRV